MFDNIGGKIKALAKIVCWIGIVLSVLLGIVMILGGIFGGGFSVILSGIGVVVGGALISWVGSFLTYGFGELIEKTAQIEENTRK